MFRKFNRIFIYFYNSEVRTSVSSVVAAAIQVYTVHMAVATIEDTEIQTY